ncbi:hypothetical protein AVEN_35796-1 [Araneus ventricosus]|uniref:RNase H type-1 domain-containing protein n=1 Tax=Araneus ventricosus TaxID=182803 RepID=A0A4Y2BJL2_ARAVE|nr:hypothetical protein AVEN_35796-1 [Araneus ventricosus]
MVPTRRRPSTQGIKCPTVHSGHIPPTNHRAELAAIYFAAGSALERNVKIKVFPDSKSSIEAIRSPEVKSNFALSVKDNLHNAKDLVSLVWVKAHAGNPGNELADHFAKIASSCGADISIPAPYSYV